MVSKTFDKQLDSIISDVQQIKVVCDARFKSCFSDICEHLKDLRENQTNMEDKTYHYKLFNHLAEYRLIFAVQPNQIIEKVLFNLIYQSIYRFYVLFGSFKYGELIKLTKDKNQDTWELFKVCRNPWSIEVCALDRTFFTRNIPDTTDSDCNVTWIFSVFRKCLFVHKETHPHISKMFVIFLDELNRMMGENTELSVDQIYDILVLILKNEFLVRYEYFSKLTIQWLFQELHKHITCHGIFTGSYRPSDKFNLCLNGFKHNSGMSLQNYCIKRSDLSIDPNCQFIHYNGKTFEIVNKQSQKQEHDTDSPSMNKTKTNSDNTFIQGSDGIMYQVDHEAVKQVPIKLSVGKFDKITVVPVGNTVMFEIEESGTSTKCGDLSWFKAYCLGNIIQTSSLYIYYEYKNKQYAVWHFRDLLNTDFEAKLKKFMEVYDVMLKESGHCEVFSKLV